MKILRTVYWESATEENIRKFYEFWAFANIFLLQFSFFSIYNVVLYLKVYQHDP